MFPLIFILLGLLVALVFYFYTRNRRIAKMERDAERSRENYTRFLETLKEAGQRQAEKNEDGGHNS